MTQQQKMAWFTLAICVAVLLAYGVLLPFVGPRAALAAFSLMSAWAFSGRFYRKRPGVVGAVVFDERDRAIHVKAVQVCAGCVYLYFVACCFTMAQLRRAADTVPVGWLDYMLWFGALVLMLSWSVAALVQYRREVA
jgi:hypothetical protein